MIGRKRKREVKQPEDEVIDSDIEDVESGAEDDFVSNDKPKKSADRVKLEVTNQLLSKLEQDDERIQLKSKSIEETSKLKQIDVKQVEEVKFVKCHKNSVTQLVFSEEGDKIFSVGKDGVLIETDLKEFKKKVQVISDVALYSIALATDNLLFVGGKDKLLYSVSPSEERVSKHKRHTGPITGITVDISKEYVYTVSNDLTMKVWTLNEHVPVFTEDFWGHTGKIFGFDILQQNRLISCGQDKKICLWKVDTQSFLNYELNSTFSIDCTSAINSTKFLTGTFEGDIMLWSATKKRPLGKLEAAHGSNKSGGLPITALCSIKGTNKFLSGSVDGSMLLCSIGINSQLTVEQTFSVGPGVINDLKYHSSGLLAVALGKDNRLGRWQTAKAKNGIRLFKILVYLLLFSSVWKASNAICTSKNSCFWSSLEISSAAFLEIITVFLG